MVKEKLKFYVFLDDINISIKNNLLRLKNVNIIIDNDQIEIASYQFTEIIKFAKKNKIPFFVKNDYRVAVKYQSNGVFLTSDNKSLIKPILLKKKIKKLGSAHNQIEYHRKNHQNCETIMLSPIFYNNKYSTNKILGIIKFNLLNLNWKREICALGGIKIKNIKMIDMTKAEGVAIQSMIKEKPTCINTSGL
jgi:thiamine monophosphate synthase